MAKARILGGTVFRTPEFKAFWMKHLGSVDAMRKSIETLKASPYIYVPALEYGRYQPILEKLDNWPDDSGRLWIKDMGIARVHLADQPNTTPLSKDQPDVVPLTRLALLDATIRKCFNSDPPIPIEIYADERQETVAGGKTHTVELRWDYGNGDDKPPTRLHFKMNCPW